MCSINKTPKTISVRPKQQYQGVGITTPDKKGVVMGKRQKIDWDNIPVTVIEEGSPNLQNPYAQLSPEDRTTHLKELCQTIYMRRLKNQL